MKRQMCLIFFLLSISCILSAQNKNFKGSFYDSENKIFFLVNLYSPTIVAPGFDFIGKMNGYLSGGGIYGMWLITKYKEKGNDAEVNFTNDLGSETQEVKLKLVGDSIIELNIMGNQRLKKSVNRKLYKLPTTLYFKRRF